MIRNCNINNLEAATVQKNRLRNLTFVPGKPSKSQT